MSEYFDPYVVVTGESGTVPQGKTDVILAPVRDDSGDHVLVLRTNMGSGEISSAGPAGPPVTIRMWDLSISKLDRGQMRILRDKLNELLGGDA